MSGFSAGFSGWALGLPQAEWRVIAATVLMAALLVGAGPSLPERPDGHDAVWSQSANAGSVAESVSAQSTPYSIVAQSTGSAPPHEAAPGRPAFDKSGLGLSRAQKRIIYENTSGDRKHPLPEDQPMVVGSGIPDTVILNEMPIHVKDEIGLLRDFKFAVLGDARAVLIVDPATRIIVDVVTQSDAEKDTGK